eukprot:scaffold45320_cov68-Phaeocystis_antarctica.AAC.4
MDLEGVWRSGRHAWAGATPSTRWRAQPLTLVACARSIKAVRSRSAAAAARPRCRANAIRGGHRDSGDRWAEVSSWHRAWHRARHHRWRSPRGNPGPQFS